VAAPIVPHPSPAPAMGTRCVVTAQKSLPCRATVLVDEAPAPARSGEDPLENPLTVPIWSMRPKVEAMATGRPKTADIPAPADAKR
jgi:hypothetical protein